MPNTPAEPKPTHQCPATGCHVQVKHEQIACSFHWFQVPAELRGRIWRAYRARSKSLFAKQEHKAAVFEAIVFLRRLPAPAKPKSWGHRAREIITDVMRTLPQDATQEEAEAAIRAAYPWGPRKHYAYVAWCAARTAALSARFPAFREKKAESKAAKKNREKQKALQKQMEDRGLVARKSEAPPVQQFSLFDVETL
jgi:hypothetical protein